MSLIILPNPNANYMRNLWGAASTFDNTDYPINVTQSAGSSTAEYSTDFDYNGNGCMRLYCDSLSTDLICDLGAALDYTAGEDDLPQHYISFRILHTVPLNAPYFGELYLRVFADGVLTEYPILIDFTVSELPPKCWGTFYMPITLNSSFTRSFGFRLKREQFDLLGYSEVYIAGGKIEHDTFIHQPTGYTPPII